MLLIFKRHFLAVSLIFVSLSRSGQLNVGFDIDDTVLFSRDVFLNIPKDKRNPIDYGWVNTHDDGMSIYIDPTVSLLIISSVMDIMFIYNGKIWRERRSFGNFFIRRSRIFNKKNITCSLPQVKNKW